MTQFADSRPPFALGRFSIAGARPFAGIVFDDHVVSIASLSPLCAEMDLAVPPVHDLFELLQDWATVGPALEAATKQWLGDEASRTELRQLATPVSDLKVHPPLDRPRQVFCTGANYFKHVVELLVAAGPNEIPGTEGMSKSEVRAYVENLMHERKQHGSPYMFTKPTGCINGPEKPIEIPRHTQKANWELELAVVIGKPAM